MAFLRNQYMSAVPQQNWATTAGRVPSRAQFATSNSLLCCDEMQSRLLWRFVPFRPCCNFCQLLCVYSWNILMTRIVLHVECESFPVSQHLPNHRQTIWGWPICLKPLADLPVQAMCRFRLPCRRGDGVGINKKGTGDLVLYQGLYLIKFGPSYVLRMHELHIIIVQLYNSYLPVMDKNHKKIPNQFHKEFNIYCKYSTWKACAKDQIKWSDFSFYCCPSGLVVWRPHWQSSQACNKPWEW